MGGMSAEVIETMDGESGQARAMLADHVMDPNLRPEMAESDTQHDDQGLSNVGRYKHRSHGWSPWEFPERKLKLLNKLSLSRCMEKNALNEWQQTYVAGHVLEHQRDLKTEKLVKDKFSSQRYRIRKELRLLDLEQECSNIEARIRSLYALITYYAGQNDKLSRENNQLKVDIVHAQAQTDFLEAQTEILKQEVERLKVN